MSAVRPVYPKQQTFPYPLGTSHLCHLLTLGAGVSGGANYPHIADQHRATSSRRGKQSTHRNNDFPFSASTFDVGWSLGTFRKRICLVDDDLQFSLLDEFGKLSEVATALDA
jgi:hypothetical protein